MAARKRRSRKRRLSAEEELQVELEQEAQDSRFAWGGLGGSPMSSQCNSCVHRDWSDPRVSVCRAYINIPFDILTNEKDHRLPLKGDHGYQYQAVEGQVHPLTPRIGETVGNP